MNSNPTRPLIAVDVGNSALKVAVFAATEAVALTRPLQVARAPHVAPLGRLANQLPPAPCHWCVISVQRPMEARLAAWVRAHRPHDDYSLLTVHDFPLQVQVELPERVGLDRLAAAVAANQLRCHGQPAIVIDVGTAITVDLLDSEGAFRGGAILPGPAVAAAALAMRTDALPHVDDVDLARLPTPIGKSTTAAIRSGVAWGTVGAVKELVFQMTRQLPATPHLFCTGGGGAVIAEQLGADAQYDPVLVLRGVAFAHTAET